MKRSLHWLWYYSILNIKKVKSYVNRGAIIEEHRREMGNEKEIVKQYIGSKTFWVIGRNKVAYMGVNWQ